MQIIKSRQYALYTKGAAVQFNMAKLNDKLADDKVMQGWHLFVDASKALPGTGSGNNSYDWKNKITYKLGLPDIGMILNGIRLKFDATPGIDGKPKEYKLYHDPGKGGPNEGKVSKSLSIVRGQTYGYMINFGQKNGDVKTNFSLPINDEQLILLDILLRESVKLITGFYDDGEPVVSKSQ